MFNVIIVPAFLMASQGTWLKEVPPIIFLWIDSIFEILRGSTHINLSESFGRLYTEEHGVDTLLFTVIDYYFFL